MKTPKDILGKRSYSDLLGTDEWKSFRKMIIQERGCACQVCRRTGLVLQVHHISYEPDLLPWEHERNDLAVLCEGCHKKLHKHLRNFRQYIFRWLTPESFQVLNGVLLIGLSEYPPMKMVYAMAELVSSPGSVDRFYNAWVASNKKIAPEEPEEKKDKAA